MAEICRVLLVTLLLYLFWLPSGLSEPDAEKTADSSHEMIPPDPPIHAGNENGDRSGKREKGGPIVSKGGDENGGNSVDFGPDGDENAKGGGDKSKDGDPPGYCRCNTAGRHVQSFVLGLFLLTFGVCLTWIEL